MYLAEDDLANAVENGVENDLYNAYITALTSEIESLKRDRDEWRDEAKRHQHIIAQMNQTMGALINRVPELEAPLEATEARVTDEAGGGKVKPLIRKTPHSASPGGDGSFNELI